MPESNEWFKIHDAVDWTGLSNHTMTPVYHTKIKNCYTKGTRSKTANTLEVSHPEQHNYEGLYVFGGLRPNGSPSNKLLLIDTCTWG
jgi:hypothetical protein